MKVNELTIVSINVRFLSDHLQLWQTLANFVCIYGALFASAKKWSTAWSVAVVIISSKENSIAWVNALNLRIASFVRSHKRYRCILFDWKAVEAINQIIIIIIIVTKAKKKICCDRMKNYWNEKGFWGHQKKAIHSEKKKWNSIQTMRWKKVGECGNFAKLKTLQMVGERIIKP